MKEKAEKLIYDFKENGWDTPNIYERLFEFTNNSEVTFAFCKLFIANFEEGATLFDDSLSYIEKEQLSELIVLALDTLKQRPNENAEAVIAYVGLQFPELLHKHLELIFELRPNESSIYAEYPWRKLPTEKIKPFRDKFESQTTSLSDKQKLFSCLLETRDLATINFAYQFAIENKLFEREDIEKYLTYYLESVGFTLRNGTIESYCPNLTYHFYFPENYFSEDYPIHTNKKQHLTWNLKPLDKKYKFGGIIQADENNPFIHLISFDEIPDGLNIKKLMCLTLGLHIRELNENGVLFYQHNNLGKPTKIGEEKSIEFCRDLSIKETEISFAETPNRWTYQDWGSSNSRENLFRLGGEPTWIQSAKVLTCPLCNEKMDFLMQLDTGLPDIEDGEIYFGSGGACYVFWCDKSKVSGYLIQYT